MNERLYPASVVEVLDGDSVRLNIDVGFRMFFKNLFRMNGIDAPEYSAGATATARLRELLPIGAQVHVLSYRPDKYGRWLVDVFLEDGRCANDILVEEGLAVSYLGGKRS